MTYECLIYILSMLYLCLIYALSIFYVCFMCVSSMLQLCFVYVLLVGMEGGWRGMTLLRSSERKMRFIQGLKTLPVF